MDAPVKHQHGVIVPTATFGNSPSHVLDLATATALSGTTPSPNALIAARALTPDLPTVSITELRDSLVTAFTHGSRPSNYLSTLNVIDALPHTYPELAALTTVPTETTGRSVFAHSLRAVDEYHAQAPHDTRGLFAALTHDIGKAADITHTPHTITGLHDIHSFTTRLGLEQYTDAMLHAAHHHHRIARIFSDDTTSLTPLATKFCTETGFSLDQFLILIKANTIANNQELPFDADTVQNRITKAYSH